MALQAERPRQTVRLPWKVFADYLDRVWKPGQHCSVFAPTGSGKTFLTVHGLIPFWLESDHEIGIIDSKGDDPELAGVGKVVSKFPTPPMRHLYNVGRREQNHVWRLVVPEDPDHVLTARKQVADFLRSARREKRWVLMLNEVKALTDARAPGLGLNARVEQLWLRGRPHVTVIAETQRGAWVPGSMYDQPTHIFLGKLLDERGRKRFKEIGGKTEQIESAVDELGEHEFVYVHRESGDMVIVKVGE